MVRKMGHILTHDKKGTEIMNDKQFAAMATDIGMIESYCRKEYLEPLQAISSGVDSMISVEAAGCELTVRSDGRISFTADGCSYELDAAFGEKSSNTIYNPKFSEQGPIKLVAYWKDFKNRMASKIADAKAHNDTVQKALDKFEL